ncbi:MAG: ABC transporter ATP-binding protein [Microvirga sp.]|nr:ABC transporter ATP-binding protein [Microvirga sp.]
MTAMIELVDISKRYGPVEVLSSVSLSLEEGSFTALLGASGCGKTTMLNMIAGLDQPSSGEIGIEQKSVFSVRAGTDVPTHRRNVGYVFQSYALWPHMTVIENVTYPLRVRHMGKSEREAKGREMLERLELAALAARYPFELSGGQQQRVAIGRALIHRPKVLLLDEPLSNLDVQLRQRARAWIAKIHKDFNLTTILVTHDHEEALSLSDRVVLLRAGQVEQDGSARDIYERPATVYAADFIGGVNRFAGRIKAGPASPGAPLVVEFDNGVSVPVANQDSFAPGDRVSVLVRANRVKLSNGRPEPSDDREIVLPFSPISALYRGEDTEVFGNTPLGEAKVVTHETLARGETFISFAARDCRCLPDQSTTELAEK